MLIFRDIMDGIFMAMMGVLTFIVFVLGPLMVFGPKFETKWFPVIKDFSITRSVSTELDPNFSWYNITFDRLRNCQPLGVSEWYVVDMNGQFVRVAAEGQSSIEQRPRNPIVLGINEFKYFRVDNKANFANNKPQKYIIAYNCHPFWITEMVINIAPDLSTRIE